MPVDAVGLSMKNRQPFMPGIQTPQYNQNNLLMELNAPQPSQIDDLFRRMPGQALGNPPGDTPELLRLLLAPQMGTIR